MAAAASSAACTVRLSVFFYQPAHLLHSSSRHNYRCLKPSLKPLRPRPHIQSRQSLHSVSPASPLSRSSNQFDPAPALEDSVPLNQEPTPESFSLSDISTPSTPWLEYIDFGIDNFGTNSSDIAKTTAYDPLSETSFFSLPEIDSSTDLIPGDINFNQIPMLIPESGTSYQQPTQQPGPDNTISTSQGQTPQSDISAASYSSAGHVPQTGKAQRKRASPTTETDAAAEKRRRNTLAARRFRQRQQDRVTELERALAEMTKERDALKMQVARWEGEAVALRGMLADSRKQS